MGLVTETLLDLLRRQIVAHGTVVWYDPEHVYLDLASSLTAEQFAGAALHRYEPKCGFFWLRKQLEPLWAEATDPPRLLLYVPLSPAQAQHALIEFEVAGAVLGPDQPPEHNTALATVARQALGTVLPPAKLEEIVGQVEAGRLSLSELDELPKAGGGGVIAVLFGTSNALEVALRFLSKPALDTEIEARQAVGDLATLLRDAFGVTFAADQGSAGLRAQLARQVFVTELVEAIGTPLPQALLTFAVAAGTAARQAAAQLAQTWRMRRDLSGSYVLWAGRVQAEIALGSLGLKLESLARIETFALAEILLQAEVEKALTHRPTAPLVDLAENRLAGFWSAQEPGIKTRWDVIADAGRVLLEAARVDNELKGKAWSAAALLSHYALGERPWCDLDAAQRHLERDFHRFELDLQQHKPLVHLVAVARQRYAATSDSLAGRFVEAYAEDRFELPRLRHQADVFQEVVAPALKGERVAYILVDALRFEMARELLTLLEAKWASELSVALATPPTLTEVGMAALLPGAEKGLSLSDAGGKLTAVVASQALRTRQERMAYLLAVVGPGMAVVKLDQLAPLSDVHLSHTLKSSNLVVVTATEEIDGLCENNPSLARRMLDDVLNQLRRGLKTLFGLGIETAVITADHGYLFGDGLTVGQAIDAPGGKTTVLKRRVWVGQGGAKLPGLLRTSLSAFGIGGELEIATPWNLSCFKAKGGATEYFHGGLSLPELVIPVLTVRAGAAQLPEAAAPVQWTLALGSAIISTRFVSVTVEGRSTELLPIAPPTVRIEVHAAGQVISVPVSAGYGFQEATRDVQVALEPGGPPQAIARNVVTLMISETPAAGEVTVHLLDASTGISLARLENVPLAITL